VRPEHVSLEKRAGFEFHSTVEVVEPVGAEAYVYLANDDDDFFVGRLPIERVPSVGDAITFYADADKVHLFDPRTEERI
jgi:ABC-type sugar transport system ATPase subunit